MRRASEKRVERFTRFILDDLTLSHSA